MVRNTKGRMGTVLNIRGVDFFEVAENFFFFGCVRGPSLETAADTWKNAVDVVAARLLRYVHAGDDIEDLDKTIRESKKDILMSTLVASSTTNFVLCPHSSKMTALPLALSDYKRYGRQMILDGFGLEGGFTHLLEGALTPNRHKSDSKSPAQIEKCKGYRGRCRRTWLPCIAIPRGCRTGYVVVIPNKNGLNKMHRAHWHRRP